MARQSAGRSARVRVARRTPSDLAGRRERERALTEDEIAILMAEASDDDDEYESDVTEEDCVVRLEVGEPRDSDVSDDDDSDAPDESSDSETEAAAPARGRVWNTLVRKLTLSEKTLDEADLQPLQEAEETYSVRRKGQVVAEWSSRPQNVQRRRDPANITRAAPGLKGPAAKNVKTEGDAFGLYISQDIIDITLRHTNRKLEDARKTFVERASADEQQKKKYILAAIDETELRAFIGMTILRGAFEISVDDMFSAKHGPPLFRAAMGKERYLAILANVSFDDAASREERRKGDKFCIMREVFGIFDHNLRRHIIPSDDITIDESLIKFRGRCPFRVYMPQKPGRYGILVRTAADAHSRYLWKAWVYPGKPAEPDRAPPNSITSSVDELVKYLSKELVKSGRNLTMDRYFTSVPLVEDLASAGLSSVGTLRANRALLPKELTNAAGRDPLSSKFAYRNDVQLTSHCPRRGKLVILASTMHKQSLVDQRSKKPETVLFYNSTKGGVDVIDAIIESTGSSCGVVRRWPTRVLTFMVSASCLNAYHVFVTRFPQHRHADGKHGGRKAFCRALAEELMIPQVKRREAMYQERGSLNRVTVNAISSVLERDLGSRLECRAGPSHAGNRPDPSHAGPDRGRCRQCVEESHGQGHKKRKSSLCKSTRCDECGQFVCPTHCSKIYKSCRYE